MADKPWKPTQAERLAHLRNPHIILTSDEAQLLLKDRQKQLIAEAKKTGENVVETIARVDDEQGRTCDFIATVTPDGKVTTETVLSK